MKSWTLKQIKEHIEAGRLLGLIKDEVCEFISSHKDNMTEMDVVSFIKKRYKAHGLINDKPKESCIVAFGLHTKEVHYFPTKKTNAKLTPNTLILLDMWARLDKKNAPYADATFMLFYSSKIKNQKSKIQVKNKKLEEYQNIWQVLKSARDRAINYIKKEVKKGRMPRGLDIDRTAHDVIGKAGLGYGIKHTVGHSLGLDSPHGTLPGINWREYSPIIKNVGYTIEPGIYLEEFGMRTELDFYVDDKNEIIITTPMQNNLEIIVL